MEALCICFVPAQSCTVAGLLFGRRPRHCASSQAPPPLYLPSPPHAAYPYVCTGVCTVCAPARETPPRGEVEAQQTGTHYPELIACSRPIHKYCILSVGGVNSYAQTAEGSKKVGSKMKKKKNLLKAIVQAECTAGVRRIDPPEKVHRETSCASCHA